jgi:hypothetical protein
MALVLACGPGMAGAARGDFITSLSVTVTPQAGGMFLYSYTLSNSSQSSLAAVALDLDVDTAANLQALSGPAGWGIFYQPGDSLSSWQSPGPQTDLLPGSSQNFSFTSALGPVSKTYSVTGLDELNFFISTNTGHVSGPGVASVTVPEPATLTLLGAGVISLLGYSRFPRLAWKS